MTENKLKTYSVQADIVVIRYEIKMLSTKGVKW